MAMEAPPAAEDKPAAEEPAAGGPDQLSPLGRASSDDRRELDRLRSCDSAVQKHALAADATVSAAGRKRVVLVAGPPLSGKGTLCDLIVNAYGLVHVSAGDLLRDHVRRGTALGAQAQPAMARGELVPTAVAVAVVVERLGRPDVLNRGCLLDNFPLSAAQAKAMQGRIEPGLFVVLEVPRAKLAARASGRRIDPATGSVYHLEHSPPPPEIAGRLEARPDDELGAATTRLATYDRHSAAIRPYFESIEAKVDGDRAPEEVVVAVAALLDQHGWGATEAAPYLGSKAFGGAFTARDARRAGFYSADDPPDAGDAVVCFQRGADFGRQGRVSRIQMEAESDGGGNGLLLGASGSLVTVTGEGGSTSYETWASFLAPRDDMTYSSICGTRKFLQSNYWRLYSLARAGGGAAHVTDDAAKTALRNWLGQLVDGDGEAVEVPEETVQLLLSAFDDGSARRASDASLYLYTTHTKLGPRTSSELGHDFSIYYRALNNALNNDRTADFEAVMPLFQHMVYSICHQPNGLPRRFQSATRVWKGCTAMIVYI
jgi:adenylate kinase